MTILYSIGLRVLGALIVGVSRPTLMKWAAAGESGSFQVGSHTRFKTDEAFPRIAP